jgi:hypothetical protein
MGSGGEPPSRRRGLVEVHDRVRGQRFEHVFPDLPLHVVVDEVRLGALADDQVGERLYLVALHYPSQS